MPKKNAHIEAKRSDVASLIDEIRLALAEELDEERETPFTEKLEALFKKANIPLAKPCTGEAHSNAHIDNCGVCMNGLSWGWTGKPLRIR